MPVRRAEAKYRCSKVDTWAEQNNHTPARLPSLCLARSFLSGFGVGERPENETGAGLSKGTVAGKPRLRSGRDCHISVISVKLVISAK